MHESSPLRLPIGKGSETELKEKLPAVEVANKVIWRDPDVKAPFNLHVGRRAKLGLFLTPSRRKDESTHLLGVEYIHQRSPLVGKIIFRDREGNLWRDVDVKGAGFIAESGRGLRVQKVSGGSPTGSWGIANRGYAERDIEMSDNLRALGVRTYRPFALIKLYEIVDSEGKKITIEEAKRRSIIGSDEEPVLELRAFVTRDRVEQAVPQGWIAHRVGAVEDARLLVAQELGIKEQDFSPENYMEWFAKTLGENVARMHNGGYTHTYLTTHNITLDCRIVDLDTVSHKEEHSEGEYRDRLSLDKMCASDTIDGLAAGLGFEQGRERYEDFFRKAYDEFRAEK